ncbi:MAG: InlB B-repeat-containing protein, partial [Bacillota bacterium]
MKKLFAAVLALVMTLTLAACDEDVEDQFVDITLESDVAEAELTQDPDEVTEGMEVTVTASEVEGYDFQRWIDTDTDDDVSTDRNYTFTVEEDVTLEAVYEEDDTSGNGGDTYTVDVSTDLESADLTVSEDGPYEEGDEITVDAPDVDTYNFVRWINADTEEEISTDQSYTFTVEESLNLEAVYEDTLEDDERTAQTIVDESSEDMSYLDTMMDEFDPAEGMTMTMHMAMEEEDPETGDIMTYDMQVELSTNLDDDENRISKLSVTMDMPDKDETMTMTMFMEESADSFTYTIDAGMFIDMMEDDLEMDADLRKLLDLDNDYVYLTIPKDLEGSDMEVVHEQMMDAVYIQLLGPDYDESDVPEFDDEAMTNLMDQLDSLKDLMNFSNLSSYDDFDLEMERNGAIAEGTFTLGGESLKDFMEDLVEEVYTDLESMDETGEMQPYDEFTGTTEYHGMMALVQSMQIPVTMEYNAEDEELFIDVNMNTLLDNLSNYDSEEESLDTIQDITMEMTMEKGTTIDDDLPDAKNLEVIGEELLKVMTVVDTSAYLGGIVEDTDLSPGTYTVSELETMGAGHSLTLPFIDKEKSEVTIDDSGDTLSADIDLYYAHDESRVFVDSPLTLSD